MSFPLLEDEAVSLIAWTTTPWTLPSNLALCVNAEFQYVKVQGQSLCVSLALTKTCMQQNIQLALSLRLLAQRPGFSCWATKT